MLVEIDTESYHGTLPRLTAIVQNLGITSNRNAFPYHNGWGHVS